MKNHEAFERQCTLWVHNDAFAKDDILFNASMLPKDILFRDKCFSITSSETGIGVRDFELSGTDSKEPKTLQPQSAEPSLIFLAKDVSEEMRTKYPALQISISDKIATIFKLRNRQIVKIAAVDEMDHAATHVELGFRDSMNRADLWAMTTIDLKQQRCLYEGQQLHYLGTIKVLVKRIYISGKRVRSAIFSTFTKPIFRSESARFLLAIQMSKEMWDFDNVSSGEITWTKVISFLTELFERWTALNARHLLTVVFFTRLEYSRQGINIDDGLLESESKPFVQFKDFYRVIACEAPSYGWKNVVQMLQEEFHSFSKDIENQTSEHDIVGYVPGRPSSARHGNMLEAINLAASQSLHDEDDPDLLRHGTHIVVLTPRPPIFDVDESLLRLTTDSLVNAGIGVDVVCLAQIPLHSVPLFCLKRRQRNQESSTIQARPMSADFDNLKGSSFQEHKSNVYVIPSWVEVSFFGSDLAMEGWSTKAANKFLPKCKMYELQMMGLSESDKSLSMVPLTKIKSSHSASLISEHLRGTFSASSMNEAMKKPSRNFPHEDRDLDVQSHGIDPAYQDLIDQSSKFDQDVFRNRTATKMRSTFKELDDSSFAHPPQLSSPSDSNFTSLDRTSKVDTSIANIDVGSANNQVSHEGSRKEKGGADSIVQAKRMSTRPPHLSRRSGLGALFGGLSKSSATTSASSGSVTSAPNAYREGSLVDEQNRTVSSQVKASISRRSSSQQSNNIKDTSKPIAVTTTSLLTSLKEGSNSNSLSSSAETMIHGESDAFRAASLSKQSRLSLSSLEPSFNPALSRNKAVAYSPWLAVSNPSSLGERNIGVYGGWQHVYIGRRKEPTIKWTALTSPAMLPFSTDLAPGSQELKDEFTENPYKLTLNDDEKITTSPQALPDLARQLVSYRLAQGFQVVSGAQAIHITGRPQSDSSDIFSPQFLAEDGSTIVMVKGDSIQILAITGAEVSVTRYQRKTASMKPIPYTAYIRAELEDGYARSDLNFFAPQEQNWNRLDHAIAGLQQEPSESHFQADFAALAKHHARFILIPVEPWRSAGIASTTSTNEDSDEEIRIEGIRKLTILWQKFRHFSVEDRRRYVAWTGHKDPNPLAIEYQTRDPSVVIAAGLENSLLTNGETTVMSTKLFEGREAYSTSNLDLGKFAQDLQSERGIKMKDRTWRIYHHESCFEGTEFTSFLHTNFQDIKSREEAVEFGNILMDKGLFNHVKNRHRFRDGNFFYSLAKEFKKVRSEPRGSTWFGSRRSEVSVPSTPLSSSSREMSTPLRNMAESSSNKRPHVALSAAIEYDLDHRKRSHQPEIMSIHYDRLHNPDNAFHFQLKWGNATNKLIEDAVSSWTSAMERCGLRLVQAPLREISTINSLNPLRTSYVIRIASQVPRSEFRRPSEKVMGAISKKEEFPYHRALLRRQDFVLDFEASSCFPSNVDITYSWGNADYKHTQFVHRSGLLFAQIGSSGEFLLFANRLYANQMSMQRDSGKHERGFDGERHYKGLGQTRHGSGAHEKDSPIASPMIAAKSMRHENAKPKRDTKQDLTPEQIKDQLESFCQDSKALEAFFEEVSEPIAITPSLSATSSNTTPAVDTSVPILELPTTGDSRQSQLLREPSTDT